MDRLGHSGERRLAQNEKISLPTVLDIEFFLGRARSHVSKLNANQVTLGERQARD
jgi:hypothetical protein